MKQVKFHGIDHFNRPVFKSLDSKEFFGDVNNLFSRDAEEEEVLNSKLNLTYFGRKFGCEPMGTPCEIEIAK